MIPMLTGLPGYDPHTPSRQSWAQWHTAVLLARLHAARSTWGWCS